MKFADIIGQKEIIEKMIFSVKNGRIPHTQLFLAEEGCQSLPLALAYAQFINCTNKVDGKDACGECPSCRKMASLAHPDLHFFFPNNTNTKIKKNPRSLEFLEEWREINLANFSEFSLAQWYAQIGLDNKQGSINTRDAQDILQVMSLKNFEATYKVVILWLVENLHHVAAPKLLKSLEEPTENTVFILICQDRERLLDTILSRSQVLKISRLTEEEIYTCLLNKYGISQEKAKEAALVANGSLTEALSFCENAEEENYFTDLFERWMRACFSIQVGEIGRISKEIAGIGREAIKRFLTCSLSKFSYALELKYNNEKHVKRTEKEMIFLRKFASFVHADNLPVFYETINKSIYYVERNANNDLLIMDMSIRLCRLFAKEKKK